LRERREDIPVLASHFLSTHARRYRKNLQGFDPPAMQALLENPWQGNVRELNHVVERAVLMAQDNQGSPVGSGLALGVAGIGATRGHESRRGGGVPHQEALARYNGNVSHAANALGLSRSALYRRLQRYGL
jgi:DNA-binding NtrC family response regulator